jgi:hypothetical protein
MSDEQVTETQAQETQVTEAKQETPPNQYAELVAELEKAGVTSSKQLEGKFKAASEVGKMANLLGEVRGENAELKRMLMDMQASMKRPKANPYGEEEQSGAVDIGDLIEKRVAAVIDREKRASLEAQQRAFQAWNMIQQDEDYPLVADKWEAKMRDPNFAIKLQAGTIDPVAEYQRVLRDHYKSSVRLAAETIKTLTTGQPAPKVHVESSARARQDTPIEKGQRDKTLQPLKEKVNKGYIPSEDDELAALTAVLLGGK